MDNFLNIHNFMIKYAFCFACSSLMNIVKKLASCLISYPTNEFVQVQTSGPKIGAVILKIAGNILWTTWI